MWQGRIVSIHLTSAKAEPMESVAEVRAVPGRGLDGDRYFAGSGTFSDKPGPDRQVTLIEIEAIRALARDYAVEIEAGAARRNLVTEGAPLNHLVGREFEVGPVRLRGVRLCEPCPHLARLNGKDVRVREGLVHRGGLRAEILTEGVIRPGDPVRNASG